MFNRRRLLRTLGILVLLAVCFFVYSVYRVYTYIPEAYAGWQAGQLLVGYMATHQDRWPRSWEDLRPIQESRVKQGQTNYSDFDRLPGLVRVDWNAQPEFLAKGAMQDGEASIVVVTRPNGSRLRASWGLDTDPNHMVAHYLVKKYSSRPSSALQACR